MHRVAEFKLNINWLVFDRGKAGAAAVRKLAKVTLST